MISTIERAIFGLRFPAERCARLTIFIFHRVLDKPDPLFDDIPTADRFLKQIRWIKGWFRVLPLTTAVEHLQAGKLPSRSACITFDDGYADNVEIAMPLLKQEGLVATFFVATGFLDGGIMWNDRVIEAFRLTRQSELDLSCLGLGRYVLRNDIDRAQAAGRVLTHIKHQRPTDRDALVHDLVEGAGVDLPSDLMMSTRQLQALRSAGMGVGAHTKNHPILAQCETAIAENEIVQSRDRLQEILQEPIDLFAYPNGKRGQDYTEEHVRMVERHGFRAAVSTNWGVSTPTTDRFELKRFTPWATARWRYAAQLLRNGAEQ